jgi:hypothetical protein
MKYYTESRRREISYIHCKRVPTGFVHTMCSNCLLKHDIEGKIEERIDVTRRRQRRRKKLLDDVKGTTRYWKLKEEPLDRTVWRTRFERGYGPLVRQTA